MDERDQTHFLNVDLDLRSPVPLDALVASLGDNALILNHQKDPGDHFLSLETALDCDTLDATVTALCDLVDTLSPDDRKTWDACSARVLNIGFQAGATPRFLETTLSETMLRRAAELGCQITVTIYGRAQDTPPPVQS